MFANGVAMTTTTTGLGSYETLPITGDNAPLFQTFVQGVGNGNLAVYRIVMGVEFEEGYGIATAGAPDTLSRLKVTRSSNGGAPVNWGAGTKAIYLPYPADALRFGAIGSLPTATGSANAHVVQHSPGLQAIIPNMRGTYIAGIANTGAVTLNIDGLGALPLRRGDGSDIGPGVIRQFHPVKWFAFSQTELRLDEIVSGWVDLGTVTMVGTRQKIIPVPAGYSQVRAVGLALSCGAGAQQTVGFRFRFSGSVAISGYSYVVQSALSDGTTNISNFSSDNAIGAATVGNPSGDSSATCWMDVACNGPTAYWNNHSWFVDVAGNAQKWSASGGSGFAGSALDGVALLNISNGRDFTGGTFQLQGLKF